MAATVTVRSGASVAPAVGISASIREPRPLGTASRFVGLQTPPSTYSRPPISTGANSHGTAQEASTASATLAQRRVRRTEHHPLAAPSDRRPRSAAGRRSARRGPRCGRRGCRACAPAAAPAQHGRAGQPAGGRGHRERQRRERRRGGPAARAAPRATAPSRAGLGLPPRSRSAPRPPRPFAGSALAGLRALAGGERRGHDRARGRPEQVFGVAEIQSRAGLEPVEQAAQPRFAERSAGAEHQSIGAIVDPRSERGPSERLGTAGRSVPCAFVGEPHSRREAHTGSTDVCYAKVRKPAP